jgi:hypothetical protein
MAKLILLPKASTKLKKFISLAEGNEIAGLGLISQDGLQVEDIQLYRQIVDKSETGGIDYAIQEFLADNGHENWKMHWHTHPSGHIKPSVADRQSYKWIESYFGINMFCIFDLNAIGMCFFNRSSSIIVRHQEVAIKSLCHVIEWKDEAEKDFKNCHRTWKTAIGEKEIIK